MILLLLIGAVVVWATALEPEAVAAKGCNAPGKPIPTSSSSGASGTGGSLTSGSNSVSSDDSNSPESGSQESDAPESDSGESGPASTGSNTAASGTRGSGTQGSGTATSASTIITSLGVLVDKATLISTRPANPATINLTVFNSTTTAGQARLLTDAWRSAGFESINAPKDDPLYPAKDLRCYGEIRYGEAGLNAARTVLMVAPCAQLVLDKRVDDSVEFAIGARYEAASVPDTVVNQLKAIRDAAAPPAVIEGQTASPRPLATIPPLPQVSCPS